jgi:hypothetical protein
MLNPRLVGHLRRTGIWTLGQKMQRLVGRPLCSLVHFAVITLGTRVFSLNVVLKHHYDYYLVYLDPKLIAGEVPMFAGFQTIADARRIRRSRRSARDFGGGWKHVGSHITRSFWGRFIVDGDWDLESRPFEPRESIVKLVLEDRQPRDTSEYQRLISKVRAGDLGWARGLKSPRDVDRYFDQLLEAVESIRKGGMRSQVELAGTQGDEVRVCIGRNGDLSIFGGGTHRLSIALVLGIDRIPVLVKRVHRSWVASCLFEHGGTVQSAIAVGIEELA